MFLMDASATMGVGLYPRAWFFCLGTQHTHVIKWGTRGGFRSGGVISLIIQTKVVSLSKRIGCRFIPSNSTLNPDLCPPFSDTSF